MRMWIWGCHLCKTFTWIPSSNIAKPISWCVLDSHDNVMNNPDTTTSWTYWQFSWTGFQNDSVTCVLSLVWINRSWYLYNPLLWEELQFSHGYCDTHGIFTGEWKTDVHLFLLFPCFTMGLAYQNFTVTGPLAPHSSSPILFVLIFAFKSFSVAEILLLHVVMLSHTGYGL